MTASQKWSLGLVLFSFVALSLVYNALQPIWEAPDESAHFGFVRYVQLHHALPRGDPNTPAQIDAWNPTSEYSQVPLYYVALAVVLGPVKLLPDAQFHPNPYVAWPGHPWREAVALHRTDEGWPYYGLALFVHLARLVSTVFGLVTLLATFGLVTTITHRDSDALFATAWLAWTPGFLLASARLDNDAAAMVAGSLTLLLCARLLTARKRASVRSILLVGACLAAALLSKLDTAFLIPLVAVAGFVAAEPGQSLLTSKARRLATTAVALAIPTGLVIGWWFLIGRTFQARVGTAAGFGVATVWSAIGAMDWSRLLGAIWNLNATWWGGVGFGTLTLWPPLAYVILAVPLVGLTVAGAVALAGRRRWSGERTAARWASILLCLSTVPLFYATIARQALPAVSLDSNARFTLPAASAVALAVVLGGRFIPLGRLRRALAIGYLAGLFGVAIATAAILLPEIPAPRIPARLALGESELAAAPLARFANGVDLIAVGGLPSALRPGQSLSVDLRWRVETPPAENFVAFVQLVERHGAKRIAGSDAIPDETVFPPRLWAKGEFVGERRQLTVPPDLPPGVYTLMVGTYHLRHNDPDPIPIVADPPGASVVSVGSWTVLPDASDFRRARQTSVRFGDSLVLRGYTVQSGSAGVRISLYWEAERPIRQDLVVSAQLLGSAGRPVSQQDGEPVDGRLPVAAWPTGQIIRDDHVVPAPAPDSRLQPIVVVYDRQTLERLSVFTAGQPTSDHLHLAG